MTTNSTTIKEFPALAKHALVIGKFYPPHNGHIHLIREASAKALRLTVLVLGHPYQSIDLKERTRWVKEAVSDLNNVEVFDLLDPIYDDYVDNNIWRAHDDLMQSKLRELQRIGAIPKFQPIDLIVSSEDYGKELATYFPGADSVVIDQKRIAHPISGTMARADLAASWKHLPLPTRRGLIPRVVVLGAESTGTTTLSLALAEHYNARYVPEYGRQYTIDWLDAKRDAEPDATMEDLVWRRPDFERIGKYQTVLENRAAVREDGFPLVVGDTDAFATAIWETRYVGTDWRDTIQQPYALVPPRDLYILTDHEDVPFEDDGYRDGEHIREDMGAMFEDALTLKNQCWVRVRGSHEDRMKVSIKMIDKILQERLTFK